MPFSEQKIKALRQAVDAACASPRTDIPGASVVVVDRNGTELFAHAAGQRGAESNEPMTLNNTFWIASCTKMVVGVACMRLVEKGVLGLDDGEQLEKLCSELRDVKVLMEDGNLVDKKRKITLRMLLTHTAGFGYSFFVPRLRDYNNGIGFDEFSGSFKDLLQPLIRQPGEGWEYGINIDWAGIAVERATRMSLNDYMTKHIFGPLELKNISMFPNEEMIRELAYMNIRKSDGSLMRCQHIYRVPLVAGPDEKASILNSGGGGCFARPSDYCQIIATLLNDGISPTTGAQILQKSTVDEMFKNQIPEFPEFGRQSIEVAKPALANPVPELYPVAGNPPQGWGLTFMLSNGGPTGRSKKAGFWSGLPNCFWWCDRENGVGGLVCSQIIPFGDAKVMGLWFDIETQVYRALGREVS